MASVRDTERARTQPARVTTRATARRVEALAGTPTHDPYGSINESNIMASGQVAPQGLPAGPLRTPTIDDEPYIEYIHRRTGNRLAVTRTIHEEGAIDQMQWQPARQLGGVNQVPSTSHERTVLGSLLNCIGIHEQPMAKPESPEAPIGIIEQRIKQAAEAAAECCEATEYGKKTC